MALLAYVEALPFARQTYGMDSHEVELIYVAIGKISFTQRKTWIWKWTPFGIPVAEGSNK